MKRVVFVCVVILTFWSCSLDNDNNNRRDFSYNFIPIENVVIPDSFILGQTYQIDVTYNRISTCHVFHDFYYVADSNERNVLVVDRVYDDSDCELLEDEPILVSFDFKAIFNQTYVFKFWQGEDEAGEDIYLTYEIPVID